MNKRIGSISLDELCQSVQIDKELVISIVDYGIAKPVGGEASHEWLFDDVSAHWLKKAVRLSRELEIDLVAVAMVIELLKQKERLEQENIALTRQLSRYI